MAKIKMVAAVAAAFLVVAQLSAADEATATSSALAAARAKISMVIEKPEQMTEVMKGLSAADQVTFLADVNAAIAAMPGSDTEKTAAFVAVNNAALSAAQPGNALALVAEVFATVPPSSLPAVSESLASGLMNRAAEEGVTYTDEQYVKITKLVMDKVNERVATEDNSGVRSGFAATMLIKASNSTTPEIVDAAISSLPEAVQNDAKTEWIPAALGKNGEKSYDAILAAVEGDASKQQAGGSSDDLTAGLIGLRVPNALNREGVITDIAGSSNDPLLAASDRSPIVDALQSPLNYQLPNAAPGEAASDTGTVVEKVAEEIEEEKESGYPHQIIRSSAE